MQWRRGCRKVVFQGSVWGTPAQRSRTIRTQAAAAPLDRTLQGCHKHTAPRLDQRTTNTHAVGVGTGKSPPLGIPSVWLMVLNPTMAQSIGCISGNCWNVPQIQTSKAALEQRVTLTEDATGALPWYCKSLSGSFSLPVFPSLSLSVYLPGSITPRYSRTTCSCWVTSSHSFTLCIEQSSSRVQHEKLQLIVLKDNVFYTLGNMEINRHF